MNMKNVIIGLLFCVILTGCATKGRVAIIDLDMRDRDQIEASKDENSVVYTSGKPENVVAQPKETSLFYIIDFLKIAKLRLRIVSVEWDEFKKADKVEDKAIWMNTK